MKPVAEIYSPRFRGAARAVVTRPRSWASGGLDENFRARPIDRRGVSHVGTERQARALDSGPLRIRQRRAVVDTWPCRPPQEHDLLRRRSGLYRSAATGTGRPDSTSGPGSIDGPGSSNAVALATNPGSSVGCGTSPSPAPRADGCHGTHSRADDDLPACLGPGTDDDLPACHGPGAGSDLSDRGRAGANGSVRSGCDADGRFGSAGSNGCPHDNRRDGDPGADLDSAEEVVPSSLLLQLQVVSEKVSAIGYPHPSRCDRDRARCRRKSAWPSRSMPIPSGRHVRVPARSGRATRFDRRPY